MLIKAKTLKGYKLHCLDGEIGTVTEFVFDDSRWTIRYVAIETGNWLMDRQVLIPPQAITEANETSKYITVNLTKKQIEESPLLYKEIPISRQFESTYQQYYGLPTYWNGPNIWVPDPSMLNDTAAYKEALLGDKELAPGLRSTDYVKGSRVHATDGEIGHISDFIIDDKTWEIRYLVIYTHNWLPGKNVIVSPEWINHIGLDEFAIYVNVNREAIKFSPEYTDETELNRDYEHGLHQHYERKGYWDDSIVNKDKE